jgi:hypothetical protein
MTHSTVELFARVFVAPRMRRARAGAYYRRRYVDFLAVLLKVSGGVFPARTSH